MRRVSRLGMIAALAVASAVAPAYAGDVTVGRFFTELAKARKLVAVDAVSAEASLRGAGVGLPRLALDKRLTEGDLTSIASSFGLSVTTEHPSQSVNETRMNLFLSSFGRQIAKNPVGTDSQGGDPGNSGNGKGQKKGHNKSSPEPL